MAIEEELSKRLETTAKAGGFIHIILPTGGDPEWASWKISPDSLIGGSVISEKNRSADFNQALVADVLLEKIGIIFVAGTPTVKVGTVLGGDDIIYGKSPTVGNNSVVQLNYYFETAKTLYFTVTGGTVDIRIDYEKNYNA